MLSIAHLFQLSSEAQHDSTEGLSSIASGLQTLSSHLASIGSSSDNVTLRDNIRKTRSQLKREINEEQIRQSNQLDLYSGNK